MGLYDNNPGVEGRHSNLFYLEDFSGSMRGEKIGQINDAMNGMGHMLQQVVDKNADVKLEIAALGFATKAEWLTPTPVPVEDFSWDDVEAGGLTNFGAACFKLNEVLSTETFMNKKSGYYVPIIIVMSDGQPTDDYKSGIAVLKQNNWFKAAIKVAIAIGDDADKAMLEEFTGSAESVITVRTVEDVRYWINFVSMNTTDIGSKPGGKGKKTKNEEMIEEIKKEKDKNSRDKQQSDTIQNDVQVPSDDSDMSGTDSDFLGWSKNGKW